MTDELERLKPYTDDELLRLVHPDPIRPGHHRYRVVFDDVNVSVWTLIGQLRGAYGWNPDSRRPQAEIVIQVAKEYGVPVIAVEAAILYYQNHRGAIDAVLAENESGPWSGPIEPFVQQTSQPTNNVDSGSGTTMAATKPATRISQLTDDELRKMVGPDPVRPGPSRYRIYLEDWHLPIWPIIGQMKYTTGHDDPEAWEAETLAATAKEWSISLDAMAAALLYYREHRCAIDSWLAENEAA